MLFAEEPNMYQVPTALPLRCLRPARNARVPPGPTYVAWPAALSVPHVGVERDKKESDKRGSAYFSIFFTQSNGEFNQEYQGKGPCQPIAAGSSPSAVLCTLSQAASASKPW